MTTIPTVFHMPGVFLLVISVTYFLATKQFTQNYLVSIGWNRLYSVSWNG